MSTHAQVASSTPADRLKEKIKARTAKVGIIGLGYVGLPLTLLYSEQKFPVTGFDIDQRKVDTLNTGGSYIYRILPGEIALARQQGFAVGACRWIESSGGRDCERALQLDLQSCRSRLVSSCGGDDQAARKHLSLREYRSGQ